MAKQEARVPLNEAVWAGRKGAIKPMTKPTKQHFEAIAKVVKDRVGYTGDNEALKVLFYLSQDLADYFAQTNPLFDKTKFVDACGFTQKQLREMH